MTAPRSEKNKNGNSKAVTNPRYNTLSLNKKKADVVMTGDAFDETDPRSLLSVAPPIVQTAIRKMMNENPFMVSWADSRLEKEIVKRRRENDKGYKSHKIEARDHTYRLNFWGEYYRAVDLNQAMAEYTIVRGAGYQVDFRDRLKCPVWTAWLISPPRDLALIQEELLYQTMAQLRRVVAKGDIYTTTITERQHKDGQITRTIKKQLNTQAVQVLVNLSEGLQNRVQGAVIHKHAIMHAMNPNPQTQQPTLPKQAESREQLEAEIAALGDKLPPYEDDLDVVDATEVEDDGPGELGEG